MSTELPRLDPETGAMFDTNVLTALRDEENVAHPRVVAFAASQWQNGILVAPQSLYEYWAVATRPKASMG